MDHFDVVDWADFSGDVNDVVVLKAAHHMGNGVGLANVGEELIAQALAFGCARNQARDINEFNNRRNDFLRFCDRG